MARRAAATKRTAAAEAVAAVTESPRRLDGRSRGSYSPLRPTVLLSNVDTPTPDVLRVLVENHARFLAFLERRVESRDVAEDLLQEALVRGYDRSGAVEGADRESVIAWFYRVLRNALVDHYRRRGAEDRALARMAAETGDGVVPAVDEELMHTVCECVTSLLETLKPEYATALRRVELDGVPVHAFAKELGITPGNAGVRVHRAREALRRQVVKSCGTCTLHGCLDCRCGAPRTR